jgi:hypothetical protein
MYIFLRKVNGRPQFKVTENERFRLINLFEGDIISDRDMDYNWEFTQVKIILRNPHRLDFKEGSEYDFLIKETGIECMWDTKCPHYVRKIPTLPTEETIIRLGIKLDKHDEYYSSESDLD